MSFPTKTAPTAPTRHFYDDSIDMPAEMTFSVVDLPSGFPDRIKCQVKYVKLLGTPLLGMAGDSPDLASLYADRGLLDVELKSSLWNLYTDLWVMLWKAPISVGDVFSVGWPSSHADYLATILETMTSDTTYSNEGDVPVYLANVSYKTITEATPIYVIVTLGARNQTGAPASGTVYARNLKALFSVGHLDL